MNLDSDSNGIQWATNSAASFQRSTAAAYVQDLAAGMASRILLIYAGGTIGMCNDPIYGYYPKGQYFFDLLKSLPTFHDPTYNHQIEINKLANESSLGSPILAEPSQLDESLSEWLFMPQSIFGKRIFFRIKEYEPLLDSSNMTMSDWIKIACDIEQYYRSFDAFIILHGTDTMAYTASALSFILENLGKTVIITGSQIPLGELRNDAHENLLGALTLAGHYVIPEVGLFFAHKLYRGNRSSKMNALAFEAFDSPNCPPLVDVGININIDWHQVWRGLELAPFKVHQNMNPNVGTLRLFPGITEATVRAFLAPNLLEGVIVETYGAGNAPNNRPDLHAAFAEAVQRGVVLVNCTQCKTGTVSDLYATGRALTTLGIVPGLDMTTECALTKLSYLLSFPNYSRDDVRRLMMENMRGELTIPILTFHPIGERGKESSLYNQIFRSAIVGLSPSQRPLADNLLRPMLLQHAASVGNVEGLEELFQRSSFHIDMIDLDGRSLLLLAVLHAKLAAVRWLLRKGANVHLRDSNDRSPLLIAIRNLTASNNNHSHQLIVEELCNVGAHFPPNYAQACSDVLRCIPEQAEQIAIYQKSGLFLHKIKDRISQSNLLHVASSHGSISCLRYLLDTFELSTLLSATNVFGLTPSQVAKDAETAQFLQDYQSTAKQ